MKKEEVSEVEDNEELIIAVEKVRVLECKNILSSSSSSSVSTLEIQFIDFD